MTGVVALALHGCAGVSVSSTTAVADPGTIVLSQPYVWSEPHSAFGRDVTFEYTLSAGNYVGARRDHGGIYFEGKELCLTKAVSHTNIDPFPLGFTWRQRCGIYVPTSAGADTKVYYYNLGTTSQARGHAESLPLGGVSASDLARKAEGNAVMAENVVAGTRGLSPMQGGVAGGLGAGVASGIQGLQAEAELVNAQFLFYQPKQNELKGAFGLH